MDEDDVIIIDEGLEPDEDTDPEEEYDESSDLSEYEDSIYTDDVILTLVDSTDDEENISPVIIDEVTDFEFDSDNFDFGEIESVDELSDDSDYSSEYDEEESDEDDEEDDIPDTDIIDSDDPLTNIVEE